MRITKPDTMAVIQRTLRWQGQDRLCVGLVAFFSFDGTGQAALLPEAQLWQVLPTLPGAPAVLDEGWAKPAGEFVVYGDACAQAGHPEGHLRVSARVGDLSRTLLVHGDRHWGLLGTPSRPKPFLRMPITPQTAFGGSGSSVNPLGQGMPPVAGGEHRLPAVEDPREPLVFGTDRPAPAGFWGVDSSAAQRLALLGPMSAPWLRSVWPHLPEGTSPAYFHSAPPAQRLPQGFFAGDEAFELIHMDPNQPVLGGRLPGLRARCAAVMGLAGEAARVVDLALQAETVWLMPGLRCGAVLYRGVLPVQDEEALDVRELVAAWEEQGAAPKGAEAMVAEAAPPAAPAPVAPLPAAPLVPMPLPEVAEAGSGVAADAAGLAAQQELGAQQTAIDAQLRATDPQFARMQDLTSQIDADTDRLLAENGMTRADLNAMMQPPPVPDKQWTVEEIDALTADIQQDTDRVLVENGLTRADLQPPAQPALPTVTQEQAEGFTRDMQAHRRAVMAEHGLTDADLAAFVRESGGDEALASFLESGAELPALPPPAAPLAADMPDLPDLAQAAQSVAMPAMPAIAAAVSAALPEPAPTESAGPLTREWVIAQHAAGQSLAGRDLSGLDLSDLDLRGADLRDALLEGTAFKASQLAGARFDGALLQQADFGGAALQGASLAAAKAHGASFAAARLDQAVLSGADMSAADFSAASLAQAQAARTDFSGSRMAGLQAAALQAPAANFGGCALARADLSGAQLQAARFEQADVSGANLSAIQGAQSDWHAARAAGADFSGADLRNTRAGAQASFADAQFTGAHLDQAAWDGVDLQRARLDQATLSGADWTAVQAQGLQMRGADARGARFDRAELAQADMRGSNLMGASLHRAQLDGTLLDLSNLHGADLYGSTIGRAHSRQAITTSTLLAVPGRPETQS